MSPIKDLHHLEKQIVVMQISNNQFVKTQFPAESHKNPIRYLVEASQSQSRNLLRSLGTAPLLSVVLNKGGDFSITIDLIVKKMKW